jgi:hypothetical protein
VYLNILGDLTDKERAIARTTYILQQNFSSPLELEPSDRGKSGESCAEEIRKEYDIGFDALPLLLNKLYAAGLLDLL